MQPSTIEKSLHRWSDWNESILRVRTKFNFIPLSPGEQLKKWQLKNYNSIWALSEKEMDRLGLQQSARYYWLACFYSDYMKTGSSPDYDAIKDVVFTDKGKFGEKVYPLLYEFSTVVGTSTAKELLALRIKPTEDAIMPLPEKLEQVIHSIRGRAPEWSEIAIEIKEGKLGYEDVLRKIGESGDIQAEWFSIKQRSRTNVTALKSKKRALESRINGIARRLWERCGLIIPDRQRGNWSKGLFM